MRRPRVTRFVSASQEAPGMLRNRTWMAAGALVAGLCFLSAGYSMAATTEMEFGPDNPFYSPSTLPFQAPPFDRIKDSDYQPAIEAGMAEQLREIEAIANDPAPATFDNTLVALEKSGQLYRRVMEAFDGVTGANTNPTLQAVEKAEAPKQAAHQ